MDRKPTDYGRAKKNEGGKKFHKWRRNELEEEEKQEFREEEMTKNAVKFSELLESEGTADAEMEGGRAGVNITEGWEHFVNITAIKVMGRKGYATNQRNFGMRK